MPKLIPSALLCASLAASAQALDAPEPLDFAMKPPEVETRCAAAIGRTQKRLDRLQRAHRGRRTFGDYVVEFEESVADLKRDTAGATFLKYVSTDKDIRRASRGCETKVELYLIDIYSRQEIYEAIKTIAEGNPALEPIDDRLLRQTLTDFKRAGQDLDTVDRARFRLLLEMHIELKEKFGLNLSNAKDFTVFTPQDLEGLPDKFVARLVKSRFGTFRVTLDQQDFFPFMRHVRRESARRDLDALMKNRATPENVALLEEILRLRLRIAKMLGYPTYSHYVLEERMAGDPRTVAKFLKETQRKLAGQGKQELAGLTALKKMDEPDTEGFYSWDFFYYHQKMKNRAGVDEEKIREYFPLSRVLDGMFDIYGKLLGVEFREVRPAQAWHPDVRLYEVRDAASQEAVGRFYTDLHARDGKYKHAAAFMLVEGRERIAGGYQNPTAALIANFDRPTGEQPSRLRHAQVETLFHEFGHTMHQTLGRAKFARFSVARVPRDFIEAPSQMMENWAWDKGVLREISAHFLDGSPLPEDVTDRLLAAKDLNMGLRTLRQIFYAAIDQAYHQDAVKDTTQPYRRLYREIGLIELAPDTYPQAGFGYLMGYAAGYYGYLWSEVYSADMFTLFKKAGLRDPALGLRYRQTILEPGAGASPLEMLSRFLGRPPVADAFLDRLDAAKPSPNNIGP